MREPSLEDLIQKKPNHWRSAFYVLFGGCVAALSAFSVHHFYHGQYNPIENDFIATAHEITATHYTAHVTGTKNACDLIANSQAGWAFSGVWRKTPFNFPDDPLPNYSRPPGYQSFGLWRWAIKPTDSLVRLTVRHDCDGTTVTSMIGPFRIR